MTGYLELALVAGLTDSFQRHLGECAKKERGWTDTQIVERLVLLNIVRGDSVDNLRILENDEELMKVVRQLGFSSHLRKDRRERERLWRKERKRAFPSPSDTLFFPILQYGTPVVGLVLFVLAYQFWKIGVNKYESTGS